MQRSPLAAVALAVLLVTAGCSGVLGGDGSTSPDEPTPVDGDAADSLPGVSDGQVTNATALLAAHEQGLVDAGFENRLQLNATISYRGEAVDSAREKQVIAEPGASEYRFRVVNQQGGGGVRFDHWGNESVWVSRGTLGDRTTYQVRDRRAGASGLAVRGIMANYINGSEATVTNVSERDGLTLYTFETTTPPTDPDALPENATNVRDYRLRFVADSQGRIHALVAQGTYDIQGEASTFYVGYRTVGLGDRAVTQPDWASEALRNGSA
ncbi:DUF7537 family lipoprotein [Haloglomus litoreum]|uniref:DUF7537 family lipoprotein n=1 Tax=Haloglomus litoreum TaxID=3034026 RepID=UPI0023E87CE8|nr:hypothetical protein [Haloglomus sp. DT116]